MSLWNISLDSLRHLLWLKMSHFIKSNTETSLFCSSRSIYWCRCMNHNSPLFSFPLCCRKLKFRPPHPPSVLADSSKMVGKQPLDWNCRCGTITPNICSGSISAGGWAAIRLKSQSKMEARLSSVFNAGWTLRCDADTRHLRWLTAQCLWKAVQTNRCPPLPLQLIRTPHLAFFFFFFIASL